jgi:hypothetical protein
MSTPENNAPEGPDHDGDDDGGAASLASLMAEAEAPEQAAQQAQAKAEATEQATQARAMAELVEQNTQVIEFAWDLVGGLLPEKIAARYGPEQRQRIAISGTALAVKRGWDIAAFMEKWGAEVAFAGALVGPSVPVILEAIRNRGKKPEQVQAQATGVLGTRPDDTPVSDTGVKSPQTATFGEVIPA